MHKQATLVIIVRNVNQWLSMSAWNVKGHNQLASDLRRESVNRAGKRHAMRLMSDAYGKGIVRAQVENTNLRAYGTTSDVTSAKCFKTCPTHAVFGKNTWTSCRT